MPSRRARTAACSIASASDRGGAHHVELVGGLDGPDGADRGRDVHELHVRQRRREAVAHLDGQHVELHSHPADRPAYGVAHKRRQTAEARQGEDLVERALSPRPLEHAPDAVDRAAARRHDEDAGLHAAREVEEVDVLGDERRVQRELLEVPLQRCGAAGQLIRRGRRHRR